MDFLKLQLRKREIIEEENTLTHAPILVTPKIYKDGRGFFLESYKKSVFVQNGITEDFVQDNHSLSSKNVLRGIHFQRNPKPQGKLVRCTKGKILDIAVDLRKNSKTYKEWVGAILDDTEHKMLYVPAGYGHAFLTLSNVAEVQYKCTVEYDQSLDGGIRWNDPEIDILWAPPTVRSISSHIFYPDLSEKDVSLPFLKELGTIYSAVVVE